MKKMFIYFLFVSLLCGCHQREKPMYYSSEYVKKIEDQKDWIFVEEELEDDRAVGSQSLFTYKNGDEFENWFNNVYYEISYLKKFKINIDTEEVKKINEEIQQFYDEYYPIVVQGYAPRYQDYRVFESEEYLSVIRKYGGFLPGSDYDCTIEFYIFDLTDGHLLSNQEILNIYGIDIQEINHYFEEYYASIGSQCCLQEGIEYDDLPYEVKKRCYVALSEDVNKLQLFIDEDMNLIILKSHSAFNDNGIENNSDWISTNFKYNFGLPQ